MSRYSLEPLAPISTPPKYNKCYTTLNRFPKSLTHMNYSDPTELLEEGMSVYGPQKPFRPKSTLVCPSIARGVRGQVPELKYDTASSYRDTFRDPATLPNFHMGRTRFSHTVPPIGGEAVLGDSNTRRVMTAAYEDRTSEFDHLRLPTL